MIFVTGDTHGDIDFLKLKVLIDKKLSYDDILIILGDCAICWSKEELPTMLKLYRLLKCTIVFLDGNHENFDMLRKFPVVKYFGASMHKIDEHIFHILRGEIMTIDDIKFLCIGGAHSIDKMFRTPNVSWWSDEDINNRDVYNALMNLKKCNYKVDYVLTHCADTLTTVRYFKFKGDSSSEQLKFIDQSIDYRYWLFGHYHFDYWLNDKKLCMYQDIYILDKCKVKKLTAK